ncbi:MAG: DUF362 domain-containing protein [Bacillota bacterium]
METVAVKRCRNYKTKDLDHKLGELLERLGGLNNFIKAGDRVLLKVNLLMGKSPEAAVTTDPRLVTAVGRRINRLGGKVVIGDSPGGPFTEDSLKKAYRASGLTEVAEQINAELNIDTGQSRWVYARGKYSKSFVISNFADGVDVIINLPILKTHGLTLYTGGVKNLFGLIPGLLKAEYHLKMPEIEKFSEMLIDLALLIKPDLTIMDGIVGMEGEGPSSGRPKKFGYLLASSSVFALDVAGAHLMGIEPLTRVTTIDRAGERGLPARLEEIELKGDSLEADRSTELPVIETYSNLIDQRLPAPLAGLAARWLRPRPVFNNDRCVGCGDCVQSCPPGALTLKEGRPEVVLDKCLRCFCCQELCPYDAVTIKRPWLSRLLYKFMKN